MFNLVYQGKINCQFWGKLICQSLKTLGLQCVTWGGAVTCRLSNIITFFHYDIRAG